MDRSQSPSFVAGLSRRAYKQGTVTEPNHSHLISVTGFSHKIQSQGLAQGSVARLSPSVQPRDSVAELIHRAQLWNSVAWFSCEIYVIYRVSDASTGLIRMAQSQDSIIGLSKALHSQSQGLNASLGRIARSQSPGTIGLWWQPAAGRLIRGESV